ncbi:E3 ubiquitin-protein ligase RNFT1 [Eucyclogobius newberryi]|uniref:E3 ubiquitin-protein ligase RNFT1 n=1 Tax=Eucyclogobius newberryi TaxID=166745 RepID=UPI003B59010D
MKLRMQNNARCHSSRASKLSASSVVMQPKSAPDASTGPKDVKLFVQPEIKTITPTLCSPAANPEGSEVRVPITSGPGESSGGASSRRARVSSHSHSHGHSRPQHQPHSPTNLEPSDSDPEPGEPSSSLSELRCLLQWLQKSLPFLIILCAKLVIQHALGLAVGIGLFTTFLYVNKGIQTQVFHQDGHSKLHCVWFLVFLNSSSILLYYTFNSETLHYCLIFLSPTIEPLGFWEVLWAVGITNFIIKFLTMGIKCLILLLPLIVVTFRSQGRLLMLTEELGQVYQAIAPVPLWFRYLVTYQEADGTPGLTFGVLLALLYLIMKLLGLYGQCSSLIRTLRICLQGEQTGTAATRSQCSEAGDVCPICQGEYRQPRALLCQHIFCDECIALWLNREKSCPLCRTVITEKVYKWRDGDTSPHLQIY